MKKLLSLLLLLIACGGKGELLNEPVQAVSDAGPPLAEEDVAAPPVADAGVVSFDAGPDAGEEQLTSCGTGSPSWDPPYVTCTEWFGAASSDPHCMTNPLRPVEADPKKFGLHAFQGPCPTKGYVGKCAHEFVWNGSKFRTVETYVPTIFPDRPGDWVLRRDEFRDRCEQGGGLFIEPVDRCGPLEEKASCSWFGGEFCRDYVGDVAASEADCNRFPGHVFAKGSSCPVSFNSGCKRKADCFSVTEWKNDVLPAEAKDLCLASGGALP